MYFEQLHKVVELIIQRLFNLVIHRTALLGQVCQNQPEKPNKKVGVNNPIIRY